MLNRALRGWANYFNVGTTLKAYRALDNYTAVRLRRWLPIQAQGQATQGRELSTLAPLRALPARTPRTAWARPAVGEGVKSCPRAGCGQIRMSGSMSGVWKRSHGRTSEAPPDERGGNRYVQPKATAPHLDSTNFRRSSAAPSARRRDPSAADRTCRRTRVPRLSTGQRDRSRARWQPSPLGAISRRSLMLRYSRATWLAPRADRSMFVKLQ